MMRPSVAKSVGHRRADAQGSPTKELGEGGKAALEWLTSAHARLLHEWSASSMSP